jgi:hypothetical protein
MYDQKDTGCEILYFVTVNLTHYQLIASNGTFAVIPFVWHQQPIALDVQLLSYSFALRAVLLVAPVNDVLWLAKVDPWTGNVTCLLSAVVHRVVPCSSSSVGPGWRHQWFRFAYIDFSDEQHIISFDLETGEQRDTYFPVKKYGHIVATSTSMRDMWYADGSFYALTDSNTVYQVSGNSSTVAPSTMVVLDSNKGRLIPGNALVMWDHGESAFFALLVGLTAEQTTLTTLVRFSETSLLYCACPSSEDQTLLGLALY